MVCNVFIQFPKTRSNKNVPLGICEWLVYVICATTYASASPLVRLNDLRHGPRAAIQLNNVLMGAAAVMEYLGVMADCFEVLVFGRLLVGVACGGISAMAPVYVSEVSRVVLLFGMKTGNRCLLY